MGARHRLRFGLLVLGLGPGFARPAHAVSLPADFQQEILVGLPDLESPVGFAFLPDGRILIVEQTSGSVRLVVNGAARPAPLFTLTDVNTAGDERGLLGVAVDPAWPARPCVYVYFTRTPGDVIYVSRLTASGDLSDGGSANLGLGNRYDILTGIPDLRNYHNGGTLRFGPDGFLYASVGDDGDPCAAQDVNTFNGKILRIDVSGLPPGPGGPPALTALAPPGNPFAGQGDIAGLVYALGLRNPFRFTVDPLTGRLYVADVGQDAWEELDEVTAGDNLGWPFREGPDVHTLSLCTEPGGTGSQSYRGPLAWYPNQGDPSQAITGGLIYRHASGGSRNFPSLYDGGVWSGDFYYGDFTVIRRNFSGTWERLGPVPGQPDTLHWATGLVGVSDLQRGPDGALYFTSLSGWELRRIVYTGPAVTGIPDGGFAPPPGLRAVPNPVRAGQEFVLRGAGLEPGLRPDPGRVDCFDVRGRMLPAGPGRALPPGVYFLRVRGVPDGTARLVVLP